MSSNGYTSIELYLEDYDRVIVHLHDLDFDPFKVGDRFGLSILRFKEEDHGEDYNKFIETVDNQLFEITMKSTMVKVDIGFNSHNHHIVITYYCKLIP